MNGEQSQGDKNGTFPALRKLRAENQGTEIASELASILGMVDYGELSAHSAEGAPDRETEAMVDAARGIMQILRGKPGCTEQDVFRHCKLAGYSTEGLHEHDGSYVTEARAAAMIWRAMMRVAPRSHERSNDAVELALQRAWAYIALVVPYIVQRDCENDRMAREIEQQCRSALADVGFICDERTGWMMKKKGTPIAASAIRTQIEKS